MCPKRQLYALGSNIKVDPEGLSVAWENATVINRLPTKLGPRAANSWRTLQQTGFGVHTLAVHVGLFADNPHGILDRPRSTTPC